MADRKTGPTVDLVLRGDSEVKKVLSVDQAESLLKFQADRGRNNWALAPKSKYSFADGKLIKRSGK